MFDKNIVSQKYRDFNLVAKEKKFDYLNSSPFPSIVLDQFFDNNFLNKVLNEFPDLSKVDSSQKYINATQTTGETNEKYTSSTSSTYNQESTCQIRQVHNVSYDYSQLSVFSNGASCYCK